MPVKSGFLVKYLAWLIVTVKHLHILTSIIVKEQHARWILWRAIRAHES